MLRLRLGVDDLARTTFAASTPYCELAVTRRFCNNRQVSFGDCVMRREPYPGTGASAARPDPRIRQCPTFLAPESAAASTRHSTLSSRRRPRGSEPSSRRYRGPPACLHGSTTSPAAAPRAGRPLRVMRIYHDHVMAPVWPTIERVVAAELRDRAWQLATEGAEVMLNTLHPRIRWCDGVLEVGALPMPTSTLPDRGSA